MALKPTIFKLHISLSDLNHNYYDAFSLTLAQHPSESRQRMMARVLAFCMIVQFQWQGIHALAALVQRTMDLSVTISGNSAYVAAELGESEVFWSPLQHS